MVHAWKSPPSPKVAPFLGENVGAPLLAIFVNKVLSKVPKNKSLFRTCLWWCPYSYEIKNVRNLKASKILRDLIILLDYSKDISSFLETNSYFPLIF